MWEETPRTEEKHEILYPSTVAGDHIVSVEDIAPIVAFLCKEQS